MESNNLPELTQEEILRYSRHLLIPGVGLQGQRKLKNASVLIIGTGGLGSAIALYLAAAGIGRIGIVDHDVVDTSNLQRQVIHSNQFIDQKKVFSAKERMTNLNPFIQVDTYPEAFDIHNAEKIGKDYDLLIDGTDNFHTRYLINDYCVLNHKPYVFGSIFRFEGQVSIFDAQKGPCYRCIFPSPPSEGSLPPGSEIGVFGVLPGTIGTIEATEAIKVIVGNGNPLIGTLLLYDALDMSFQKIKINKNPECKICGSNPEITQLAQIESPSPTPELEKTLQITPAQLQELLKSKNDFRLIDIRNPIELEISRLPEAENIPYEKTIKALNDEDCSTHIILICRTGIRSSLIAKQLVQKGYTKVNYLSGGLNNWSQTIDLQMLRY